MECKNRFDISVAKDQYVKNWKIDVETKPKDSDQIDLIPSKPIDKNLIPYPNRKCKDIVCLIIFIIISMGQAFVVYESTSYGDPTLVFFPKDSSGQLCGFNNVDQLDLTNFPYLYLTNPFVASSTSFCVSNCPSVISAPSTISNIVCSPYSSIPDENSIASSITAGNCTSFVYSTKLAFNYCVPKGWFINLY